MPDDNKRPIHRIRSGALSVSIWDNESEHGVFYSANVNRSYTKDDGKTFNHTDNFGRDDLLTASKLLDLAQTWILRKEAQDRAARPRTQASKPDVESDDVTF